MIKERALGEDEALAQNLGLVHRDRRAARIRECDPRPVRLLGDLAHPIVIAGRFRGAIIEGGIKAHDLRLHRGADHLVGVAEIVGYRGGRGGGAEQVAYCLRSQDQ